MTASDNTIISVDPEWAIGDAMNAAASVETTPNAARNAAARATRKDISEITWIGRTCVAFPSDQRRHAIPFDLHRAVLPLPVDDRLPMLDRAGAEGWSGRETRRQVLSARIAAGDYFPNVDDDVEDKLYRRIAQAWNRASIGAREMFAQSIEEADLAEIIL